MGLVNPRRSAAAPLLAVLALLTLVQCRAVGLMLPPLDEQKAHIREGQIQVRMLSPQAFVETWGEPTYAHQEDMQFYPVENGNYVPRFRVPVGEWPRGWDSTIVSEEARFLAYADRGELLGFVNDRLVYRERMSTEQIHAVGKMWQRESLFKTRLETDRPSPSKP
jgi:hypothetical protein